MTLLWLVTSAHAAVFTSELVTNLPPTGGLAFSSNPGQGVAMGGYFYFPASDGPNGMTGRELWRTDGTTNGTILLKDIRSGAGDSSPDQFVVAGTNLYFVANDGSHGKELWKSDGTAAGTVLVADLNPGADGTVFGPIKPVGNGVYFSAYPEAQTGSGSRLFKTDGTTAGTVQLAGPGASATTNSVFSFDVWSTNAVFISFEASESWGGGGGNTNSLWRTDGTPAGTQFLERIANSLGQVTALEPNCYFVMPETSSYVTGVSTNKTTNYYTYDILCRRSLIAGGTFEYVDGRPGQGYETGIGILQSWNGLLYFAQYYPGSILSPGAAYLRAVGNTTAARAISDGSFLGIAGGLGSFLYYTESYYDGFSQFHEQLYRTDGSSGTLIFNFDSVGFFPTQTRLIDSRFLFVGARSNQTLLGITNLTQSGTALIPLPNPGALISQDALLGGVGSQAFLALDDGLNGTELWVSDGTTNGTHLLKDIAQGTDSPPPGEAVAVGNVLFLSADTPNLGVELWKSDGTAAGTTLVKDIRPGSNGSSLSNLTACNGLLYFAADDGTHGLELWRSDGTEAGTIMVRDCRIGAASSNPSQLTAAGSILFFVADDGSHGAELWRSDGTSNGTYMVQDLVPGLDPAEISRLVAVGNIVFFTAKSGSYGHELWFSDGQPGGTQFLKDLNPGSGDSFPGSFRSFAGNFYFLSSGLWRTDLTPDGTVQLNSTFANELCSSANLLYFSSAGLWKSDGTTNGTSLLTNLYASHLTALGSNLYFTVAEDLWISDGTPTGTALEADFLPPGGNDPSSAYPLQLTPFLGTLLFTSGGAPFGREIWATAPGQFASLVEDLEPGSGDADIRFFVPASDKVFYIARPSGQPGWQVRKLRLQNLGVPPRSPWGGSPGRVPGRIEAENFDVGGEGQAYHDTTLVNEGGQYRKTQAVDIDFCDDTGGGFCITHTQPGEWLEYTFTAPYAGIYRLDVRVSSPSAGATFEAAVDGLTMGGVNDLPNTGMAWSTVSLANVITNTGVHVLRLTFDTTNTLGSAGSVNWLEWTFVASNQPPTVTILSPDSGAVFSSGHYVPLAAQVLDDSAAIPPQLEFFIDGQSIGVDSTTSRSWQGTPGAHLLRVAVTDAFGATSVSADRLFFVSQTVVDAGSSWLYNDSGANLGTTWFASSYNDGFWPEGPAQLGFGDGDEATVLNKTLPRSSVPIVTYYFRKHFVLTNAPAVSSASITLLRDDAAAVYVNGHGITAFNLPRPFAYNTPAVTNIYNPRFGGLSDGAVDTFDVPTRFLTNGDNVLAVEVHQSSAVVSGPEFDLSFDLIFSTVPFAPVPRLSISTSGNTAILQWPDYGGTWQLEQSTDLNAWGPAATGTSSNGVYEARLPLSTRAFFRLHAL